MCPHAQPCRRSALSYILHRASAGSACGRKRGVCLWPERVVVFACTTKGMRTLTGVSPSGISVLAPPGRSQTVQHSCAHLLPLIQSGSIFQKSSCVSSFSHSATSRPACRASGDAGTPLYSANQTVSIQESWQLLMRWSKAQERVRERRPDTLQSTSKVVPPPAWEHAVAWPDLASASNTARRSHHWRHTVECSCTQLSLTAIRPVMYTKHVQVCVLGGGSFATAMAVALARRKGELEVVMLLRRQDVCEQINAEHRNGRYLPDTTLPKNITATTDASEALCGAQYAILAVPVQASRRFLEGVKDLLLKDLPIVCVAKGIEQTTSALMSEVIPSALGREQPTVFLSGPSFAKEVWLDLCRKAHGSSAGTYGVVPVRLSSCNGHVTEWHHALAVHGSHDTRHSMGCLPALVATGHAPRHVLCTRSDMRR